MLMEMKDTGRTRGSPPGLFFSGDLHLSRFPRGLCEAGLEAHGRPAFLAGDS